jgi:hypothetical protein
MIVTDKEYYLENLLVNKLDIFVERQNKNFDHLILLDGDEGFGKSTFSWAIAYYLAEKTGKSFTTQNIFFDADKMMEFASKNESQIIIWDEAAIGGMGMQWQSSIQQKLVMALMIARKKKHFWFFLIPKFYKLKDYIVERAIGLVHVYSPNDMNRGYFVYFNKKRKMMLYNKIMTNKFKHLSYKQHSFHGKFTRTNHIINEDEYEQMKDKAIMEVLSNDNTSSSRWQTAFQKYSVLTYKLA